uniref:Immunoglobulin subtype domain-containing protein n=1 Tax=Oryzias latipes TaxID=8090 RepID=A0A3P9LW39_ORYLA
MGVSTILKFSPKRNFGFLCILIHATIDLLATFSGCTDDLTFQTKTVVVGDYVKLGCSRRSAGNVFWLRTISGNPPEFLDNYWSKPKLAYKAGILELQIADTSLRDTAFYICVRKKDGTILSLNLTYLIVQECSENFLTVQCSVLQDSQNKSCPSDENVFCFSAESKHSNTNRTAENSGDAAAKDFCFSSFFKNLTSSGDLKYYCAIPKCEERIQKNESLSQFKVNTWNSNTADVVRNILIAALFVSQMLIAFLFYLVKKLKKESKSCCHDGVLQQIQMSTTDLQYQQASNKKSTAAKYSSFRYSYCFLNCSPCHQFYFPRKMKTCWFIQQQFSAEEYPLKKRQETMMMTTKKRLSTQIFLFMSFEMHNKIKIKMYI